MRREIGSEFFEGSAKSGVNNYIDLVIDAEKRYVLSGRTALAYIIEDIKSRIAFQRIALPEYCCGSMIEPFFSKNIEILYYGLNKKKLDFISQVDAVLVMDYFGVENPKTLELAREVKKAEKILIVDATQTAFSKFRTYKLADYVLASYRKWTDCLCAAVYCKNGFLIEHPNKINKNYAELWRKAAVMKRKFLFCNRGNKKAFLQLYKKANECLAINYDKCSAPDDEIRRFEALDSNCLRYTRRENAMILIKKILEIEKLEQNYGRLIYKSLKDEDCPLFVPVLFNNVIRNVIREQLIKHSIYCPIHWPIDTRYPHVRTQYHDTELSLICDQRYEKKDILWEANELSNIFFRVAECKRYKEKVLGK